jgi:hypothetical protein
VEFWLGVNSRGDSEAGDPPPGGGSVRGSLSRHNAGGLAWKRERRWGNLVMGALRCSYL